MQKSVSLVVTAALGLGLVGISSPTSSYASTPQACADISAYDVSEDAPVYNSSTSKFEISRHDQLIYLSENFESAVTGVTGITNDWREQDFVLAQSVNLDGCNFTPIGGDPMDDAAFTGTFDGQGNSILGLVSEGNDFRGLFGVTDGDSSSSDYVEISNLTLAATIDSSATTGAGALVGYAMDTKISQVFASGTASIAGNNVGGLVGELLNSTISHTTVGVRISSSSGKSIGGMIGSSSGTTTISNSYALGNVSGEDVGGIVGAVNDSKITLVNAYAAGSVTGSGSLGGLVGKLYTGATVTAQNSFWDINRTGRTTSAGGEGTGKTSVEMTTASTFSAWNGGNGLVSWAPFDASTDTIWGMCSGVNDGYPYLLWEYTTDPCASDDSGDSSSAHSNNAVLERATSAGIHFDTGIEVGNQYSGTLILAEGEGLARGQAFSVTLNLSGQVLASGEASRLGYFSTTTTLPTGLTPGTYTLTLTTKDPAGNPLVLTERFGIDASGLFTGPSPTTASNSGTGTTNTEATPAAETSGEATEAPKTSADPDTSDATEASTTTQGSDDNTTPTGNSNTDSSTNSSPEGTSDPIPGWLVITASSILITLVLGGVGIGIYRARQSRAW